MSGRDVVLIPDTWDFQNPLLNIGLTKISLNTHKENMMMSLLCRNGDIIEPWQ